MATIRGSLILSRNETMGVKRSENNNASANGIKTTLARYSAAITTIPIKSPEGRDFLGRAIQFKLA
jgi:hypothetical protein